MLLSLLARATQLRKIAHICAAFRPIAAKLQPIVHNKVFVLRICNASVFSMLCIFAGPFGWRPIAFESTVRRRSAAPNDRLFFTRMCHVSISTSGTHKFTDANVICMLCKDECGEVVDMHFVAAVFRQVHIARFRSVRLHGTRLCIRCAMIGGHST